MIKPSSQILQAESKLSSTTNAFMQVVSQRAIVSERASLYGQAAFYCSLRLLIVNEGLEDRLLETLKFSLKSWRLLSADERNIKGLKKQPSQVVGRRSGSRRLKKRKKEGPNLV